MIAAAVLATCIQTGIVEDLLFDEYGESLSYVGYLQNGNILELYENTRAGTKTTIVSVPDQGISCLVEYKSYKGKTIE